MDGRIIEKMVILITGASHTGKTLLSQKLLEKYKYPYLSIDHLKMGLIRSGYTSLTPEDDDKLTDYLWPIIREIIKTVIENKQNLIIEGCYIPLDWQKDFSKDYLDDIRFYILALSEKYIKTHFPDIKQYADIIEKRLDHDLSQENVLFENAEYIRRAKELNLNCLIVDDDYNFDIEI